MTSSALSTQERERDSVHIPYAERVSVVVRTSDLEVRYGKRVALSGVDLELPAATTVAVIGPNGSGKSTLLRALAGLVSPSRGSVHVEASGPPAMVLQSTELDPGLPLSVRETVLLARYARLGPWRRPTRADREAVSEAMERLDVAHLANRHLHELSGGQRQRALVAQGIAQESAVLLLDEPVAGLDMPSHQLILDVVDQRRAAGGLVVMTTHSLRDARRCDRVLLLDTVGIAYGPPEQVLSEASLRRAFGERFARRGEAALSDHPH